MVNVKESRFSNIFQIDNNLSTRNLSPGYQVYGETLYTIDDTEYRIWNPTRSKLAALILNGCKILPITQKSDILYLGAANGTTASHISDIAIDGKVYCIEFSSRAFKDLLELARVRKNIFPILEDAFHPERYRSMIEKVNLIYQDLSQRDQIRAFITNAKYYLKSNGHGIIMVKSRSIDMTKSPHKIFQVAIDQLKKAGFKPIEQITLEPYTKDHLGLVLEWKK